MKKVKILGFIMVVALLLTVAFTTSFFGNTQSVFAQSSALEQVERATFETDSVIVTLTKEATNRFLEYSAESFSQIGCIDIEDLTESTVGWVRSRARGQQTQEKMMVDTEQFKRILRLELRESGKESVLRAIKMLEEREDVLSASPNYIYSINIAPNDTHYVHSDQWGLNGNRGVRAEESWNITRGANIVNVGVMDTGIQANHPDLTNRISNAGLHRDCTVSPIATVATPNDPNGHGTHVAGIIGAQGSNNVGIAGVAWDVRLISLRVFDANGNGTLASIARAVNFAAGQNIPILNFSGGTTSNDTNIRNAIAGYTGLFLCAAGNNFSDNDVTFIILPITLGVKHLAIELYQ